MLYPMGIWNFYKNIQDTIAWEIAGHAPLKGKANYLKAIAGHKLWKVKELDLETIITHGPDASVSGQFIAADNSKFVFCDIFRFKKAGGNSNKIHTDLPNPG